MVCAGGACNRSRVAADPRSRFGFVGIGARRVACGFEEVLGDEGPRGA